MRAHLELCGAFKDFCIENAGSMWMWNGKGQSGGIDEWIDGASANLGDFSFVPSICGGGSGGSAPASKPAGGRPAGKDLGAALTSEVADKIAALKAASAALGIAQVSKATDQFLAMMGFNTAMLTAMAKFKKPTDTLFLKDPYGALAEDMNKVKDRDMKAPVNHMKGLCDSIPIFFWFSATSGEEAKDYLVEFHGQIFFWTNKILKEGKPLDDAWTNAFTACATALKDFVIERRDTILNWNGSEDGAGAKAFYEAAVKSAGGATAAAPTTAPAAEEKKTAPAPVKAAAGAPVKKVKAPIKELVRNRWAIENQGKEHLKFEGEDQVNRKIAFQIFDCKETTIEIVGKAQNVLLQNCQKVTLIVDKLVSQVELGGCKVCKVICRNQTPDVGPGQIGMITAENCNEVIIQLQSETINAKISTICCRSIIVKYPKEGSTDAQCDEEPGVHLLSIPVAEVYETVIVNGTMVTTPMEAMD